MSAARSGLALRDVTVTFGGLTALSERLPRGPAARRCSA